MNVLALNPGSSSLRFQLLRIAEAGVGRTEADEPECLATGSIAALGPHARARAGLGRELRETPGITADDHEAAAVWAFDWLAIQDWTGVGGAAPIDAVGVRVVHGGLGEGAGTLVTPAVEVELEREAALAPLHGAGSLASIRRARRALPDGSPIVAVSDGAFHAGMPEVARTYALPLELAERHGIRRFGFHGLAITSVLEQHARSQAARGRERDQRIVVLHLGSGASVTATRGGRSVDTSMGFSPLEGLVMATRSGDLDPALIPHLARAEKTSADEVVRWLNERSGLLGISGRSGDMRALERLQADGDPRAKLAFDLFCYRAKKYLAAMIATLGGVDAVCFSGGIGENSAAVRAAVCSGMEWCGIVLDAARNEEPARSHGEIAAPEAPVGVHVVPADEERVIARETCALLLDRSAVARRSEENA